MSIMGYKNRRTAHALSAIGIVRGAKLADNAAKEKYELGMQLPQASSIAPSSSEKMMNKPFAIDIDDVLGHMSAVLHPALNTHTNQQLKISDWHRFDIYKLYGISLDSFLGCIIENELLSKMPPCEGAKEALDALKMAGADVVLITSRGYYPNADQVTADWLDRLGMAYDDLIVVPEGTSKGEIAKSRYPRGFSVMVDDHAANLDSMKEHGLVGQTILVDRPWNKHRDDYRFGINRFNSLSCYVNALKAESVPQRKSDLCTLAM